MDAVVRRILSGVLLLLFALSGGYVTASARVTSSVRIEISIVEREASEQNVRPGPVRIRECATRKLAEAPAPRIGLATVLYQRPPPSVQTQI
jgi:hypothetical protein